MLTLAYHIKTHPQEKKQVNSTYMHTFITSVFSQNLTKERWLEFVHRINIILLQIKLLLLYNHLILGHYPKKKLAQNY